MLDLVGVSKRYGPTLVLHPTTLTVPAGKTLVLIGPSGCGKTTLLKMMLGLVLPDSGEVRFDGQLLLPRALPSLRRRFGYVMQDGGLFPHLTARANVTLVARFLGWEEGRLRSRLAELGQLVQLPAELLERYPAQLSGGQRQRVGLMRALMLNPDLLLLDEPLGALDPLVRFDLQQDLRRIFQALGKTVVLVTHDLAEAAFFGDEVVLLGDGQIMQRDVPAKLLRHPANDFVRRFLAAQRPTLNGSPA